MIALPAQLKFPHHYNILGAGIRMIELCKLFFRVDKFKKEDNAVANYIQSTIEKGDTVLDIGSRECNIYLIRKKMKGSGILISFQTEPYQYKHLCHLKKILDWKNVDLEFTKLSDTSGKMRFFKSNTNALHGAIVINIKESINDYSENKMGAQTLDDYCSRNYIAPDFIKIDANGNELNILVGAINILKNYKPKILLKCEERIAGIKKASETFELLKELNYTGSFVLDSITIPLMNFDFNVYQNESKDFYCSYFMFE